MPQLVRRCFFKGDYEQAALLYRKMIEIKPGESSSFYNLACLHAKQGQVDQAVRWLKQAVDRGYSKWDKIRTDPDLENIRSAPGYLKLIEGA